MLKIIPSIITMKGGIKMLEWARKNSPWAFHFCAGGGCNGCDIEVVAAICPRYDPERLGVKLKGSPRHADILLVTDSVTKKNKKAFMRVYNQVPEPKVVVAVGNCAITGELFRGLYGVEGPIDKLIPVDVYIPGCPPRPEEILKGVKKAVEIFSKRKVKK
jgi:membrane-bound hydrogenase subunit mbhJ